MHDVIPTKHGSERSSLAAALGCFAVAGVATVAVDHIALTIGATGLAVGGVACLARYARSVTRKRLAATALGLWLSFLGVAVAHAVGLEPVGSSVPGPTRVTVVGLTAITWATLLAAAGATIFLGFREYGASTPAEELDEQVFDGETTDYSTR
ncbi:hypothetical protein [Natrinema pallidum]|uniref:Uncharacterized protein n=1 Tax=Natrinema pallidum DSM 3751 TaxID=1227495 RepID=L9YL20_9EURY|nr:hypothetical protein [Natrinema pallidum]ELY74197.1 hypothetical protein C487_15945 [Natrinema pallidum DSM 3751]